MQTLLTHPWPGNIRELENLIRRLAAVHPQDIISDALVETELNQEFRQVSSIDVAAATSGSILSDPDAGQTLSTSVERHLAKLFADYGDQLPPPGLYHRILKEIEIPLITAALAATRGNQIKAAELLGLNRNTLRKKIRAHSIEIVKQSRRQG